MITEQPFYVQLLAAAGAVGAAGVIWRMALWPFFRACWAAISAAPRIADDLAELKQILRADLLAHVEEMSAAIRGLRVDMDNVKDELRLMRMAAAVNKEGPPTT